MKWSAELQPNIGLSRAARQLRTFAVAKTARARDGSTGIDRPLSQPDSRIPTHWLSLDPKLISTANEWERRRCASFSSRSPYQTGSLHTTIRSRSERSKQSWIWVFAFLRILR